MRWPTVVLALIILVVSATAATTSSPSVDAKQKQQHSVSFEHFQCGHDLPARTFAYELITGDCPSYLEAMNQCCVIHDDCYTLQLGQKKCDDNFCECNRRALIRERTVVEKTKLVDGVNVTYNVTVAGPCNSHADVICWVMPYLGQVAYEASANYTAEHCKPSSPRLHEPFLEVKSTCSALNESVNSCCSVNSVCKGEECEEQMCSCLRGVVDSSPNVDPACSASVDNVCTIARSPLENSKNAVEDETLSTVVVVKEHSSLLSLRPDSYMLWIVLLVGSTSMATLLFVVRRRRSPSTKNGAAYTEVSEEV